MRPQEMLTEVFNMTRNHGIVIDVAFVSGKTYATQVKYLKLEVLIKDHNNKERVVYAAINDLSKKYGEAQLLRIFKEELKAIK